MREPEGAIHPAASPALRPCFGLLLSPCHPQVVLKSKDDQVTVIGAGVTLHEALAAAEMLKKGKKKGTRKVTEHRLRVPGWRVTESLVMR